MNQKIRLTIKDILFAGINGLVFGVLLPIVMRSFNVTVKLPHISIILFFVILATIGVYIGYLLSKIKPFFFQLAKFGATGAANFALDIGILSLLIILIFPQSNNIPSLPFALFKITSFILASTNSYIWNKFWSFQDKDTKNIAGEFGKFILVSSIGLVINASIAVSVNSLHHIFQIIDPKTWAAISAMTGAVLTLIWNFIGYKFLVFKK